MRHPLLAAFAFLTVACGGPQATVADVPAPEQPPVASHEVTRVLALDPGVTATIVAPARLDTTRRVDLIIYALPNGNSTAETIGGLAADGVGWRYDIQHIGAQTRALRARGVDQAVVAYVEADRKSWPEWRRRHGYDRANARIVSVGDELRAAIGNPPRLAVTLTGHSGGGSFIFGFIDGVGALPGWIERIAFLDANYSYEPRHGAKLTDWLRADDAHTLVVVAYDDRNIMLDGKRVVSDSGGTWRASHRMLADLAAPLELVGDTLGDFRRHHDAQVEILLHPNPENRILHTELVGEMNGYMHAMLLHRPGYGDAHSVLKRERVYGSFVEPVRFDR